MYDREPMWLKSIYLAEMAVLLGSPMNHTLEKFGYPENLVEEASHWVVLLRPAQVTLGALVLISKEPVRTFPDLSKDALVELQAVTGRLERSLRNAFAYDKINYLMLMMVDPDVHFHVIPRYAGTRHFGTAAWQDSSWPGPPDLTQSLDMSAVTRNNLREHLVSVWG